MILNNNLLKNLYTKYRLSKKEFFKVDCPSPEKILEAIRNPSRKTRAIMDHLMDCNYCYLTFLFLRDVEAAEGILEKTVVEETSEKKAPLFSRWKQLLSPARLQKVLPYSVALLAVCAIIYGILHFLILTPAATDRSVIPSFSISLLPSPESKEKPAYVLEWNQLPGIKFYMVYVFDSTLKITWKTIVSENKCSLPPPINEAIMRKENLYLSLEAFSENDSAFHLWLGDISSIMTLRPNKATQNRRL